MYLHRRKGAIMSVNDALRIRRSIYQIGEDAPIDDDAIVKIVTDATELVPDAFNMRSQRVIVALGDENKKLWDAAYDAFGGKVARERIDGFAAGRGTVLYYIDDAVVSALQEKYALYADNFPIWAQQANGMLQIAVWAGLAEAGVGANIQHYNPVIDAAVAELFDVPQAWRLVAQMPFGGIAAPAGEKDAEDISLRVVVKR